MVIVLFALLGYLMLCMWMATQLIEDIARLRKLPRPWLHIPLLFLPVWGKSLSELHRSAEAEQSEEVKPRGRA